MRRAVFLLLGATEELNRTFPEQAAGAPNCPCFVKHAGTSHPGYAERFNKLSVGRSATRARMEESARTIISCRNVGAGYRRVWHVCDRALSAWLSGPSFRSVAPAMSRVDVCVAGSTCPVSDFAVFRLAQLRFSDEVLASDPTESGWAYRRPECDGVVEVGTLRGNEVGLPTHFHNENQITFVLSGRRRFLVRSEVIILGPGQGTLIPPGVAHRSFAEPRGVVCLNVYGPPGDYDAATIMHEAGRLWGAKGRMSCADLATIVSEHWRGAGTCVPACSVAKTDSNWPEPVSRAAERAGMSREGFSRKFARDYGMPPHAFWLMARLNEARALLRTGEGIAEVAVKCGFSDQSHLGRWFRRAFGVTPGRFRLGWSRPEAPTAK